MNLGCDCVWVGVGERRGGSGSEVVPNTRQQEKNPKKTKNKKQKTNKHKQHKKVSIARREGRVIFEYSVKETVDSPVC